MELLGDFCQLIDLKAPKIKQFLQEGLIKDFEIEVHALKNTSRMIGAESLSGEFYDLEKYANINDIDFLNEHTPSTLEHFLSYKEVLAPYRKANNAKKEPCSTNDILTVLDEIYQAMDQFDLDAADAAMAKLNQYELPEAIIDDINLLQAYMSDVAIEEVMNLCAKTKEKLI